MRFSLGAMEKGGILLTVIFKRKNRTVRKIVPGIRDEGLNLPVMRFRSSVDVYFSQLIGRISCVPIFFIVARSCGCLPLADISVLKNMSYRLDDFT